MKMVAKHGSTRVGSLVLRRTMFCSVEELEQDYIHQMQFKGRFSGIYPEKRAEFLTFTRQELEAETCFEPHVKANLLQNLDRIIGAMP